MAPPSADISAKPKPRISYLIATVCGIGYLRPAPGTWGSVVGVLLSIVSAYLGARWWSGALRSVLPVHSFWTAGFLPGYATYVLVLVVALIGVIAADRVSKFSNAKDPQFAVVDEVSGQLIALSFPFVVLNWKSWLLGFILFRIFDIWKPFPARQAESLPGGWGIMADDWIAGVYAGLVLALAQRLGL